MMPPRGWAPWRRQHDEHGARRRRGDGAGRSPGGGQASPGAVRPVRHRDVGALQLLLDAVAVHALPAEPGRRVRLVRGVGDAPVLQLPDVRLREPPHRRLARRPQARLPALGHDRRPVLHGRAPAPLVPLAPGRVRGADLPRRRQRPVQAQRLDHGRQPVPGGEPPEGPRVQHLLHGHQHRRLPGAGGHGGREEPVRQPPRVRRGGLRDGDLGRHPLALQAAGGGPRSPRSRSARGRIRTRSGPRRRPRGLRPPCRVAGRRAGLPRPARTAPPGAPRAPWRRCPSGGGSPPSSSST